MGITLTAQTTIAGEISAAVRYAVEDLQRDIAKTLLPMTEPGAPIILVRGDQAAEQYDVQVTAGRLEVVAADDFGFIYGLYAISREVLGVKDLWFWNDQEFVPVNGVDLDDSFRLRSTPSAVRYKGFFINDEVLLLGWSLEGDKDLPWRIVFETIYRLGGNLVIPGSGERIDHTELAQDMGFYIAQHHACPLGARMFSEVYPGVEPRWPEERDRFEELWRDAVEERQDARVVWTLGFRGQGDSPFWTNDPRYDTPEARAEVINTIIRRQHDLVRAADPDAVCCIYLYDESMELYERGLLDYPDDIIKLWSDNGYARMVSRMTAAGEDLRIPAMPDPDGPGGNGIYFHASYFDLKASNHITQRPADPRRIAAELEEVIDRGGDDVWVINASNIKPHVYLLNLMAAIWRDGHVDTERVCRDYVASYYGADAADALFPAFEQYWQAAASFGPEWDNAAGELLFNFVPRILISQFLTDREAPSAELMLWLCAAPTLQEQVRFFASLCDPAVERYDALVKAVERAVLDADDHAAELIRDTLLLQARVYQRSIRGSSLVCQALLAAWEGDWRHAFYRAGLARDQFRAGDRELRDREHGKWRDFYREEALCGIKETAWVISALMGYLRVRGDGPYFYRWQREFTYTAQEKDVVIVLNLENRKDDDEIFAAMKTVWQR
ncbi:MAG: glycosyl hydrolase 115 family protein [Microbacterium sp.]|uniref:glycosyl hydrolase 115 family protein n=1 Tax=Microbacterium sp. TaxID=51671 RepID=UPI0039E25F32